jgi:glutamate-1-semialdehyde aminotransferase
MDSSIKNYNYKKSNKLFERAKNSIPSQCHTLSHGPTQYVSGISPKFIEKGEGCYVWDVDGNKFLDLAPGGFPAILGYGDEEFNEAINKQLKNGLLFPMPSNLEVEVAEKLIECIPCAERVKFAKNGSDVTTMAIRLARAITGREKVATGGYHGFHDWYICTTNRTQGIPEETKKLTLQFEYNELESLKKLFKENPGEIAAIILEPVQLTAPKDDFLNKAKKLAHENGALFILDEIITGFRFRIGGAQEYFGVTPDLATFGKALGNGMPISALVGKKEYMDRFSFEGVFFSSTFGGECGSLAAASKMIDILKERNVIDHIWEIGKKLKEGFNNSAKKIGVDKYLECKGFAPCTDIEFETQNLDVTNLELKSLFQQECMKRGLLAGLYHAPCYAHKKKDIDLAIEMYEKAMESFKKIIDSGNIKSSIVGDIVKPVFRTKE